MGFFDSFSRGVGDFFSGAIGFLDEFSQTRIGGELVDFGLGEFADLIGLDVTPSRPNDFRGAPPGPLGRPVTGPTNLQLAEFCRRNPGVLVPGTTTRCGGAPGPVSTVQPFPPVSTPDLRRGGFVNRPQFGLPPVPSSQPFGPFPGTSPINFGGDSMVAFPTFLNASFNPSPRQFTQAGFPLAPLLKQLPGFIGGVIGGGAIDALTSGGGGGAMTPMFKPTVAGVRAQRFRVTNPVTGQDVFFLPAGKPILWSSDLSACKRVNKVARRARRKR